jgi:hypothetical protein
MATETIMIGAVPVVTLRELLGPSLQGRLARYGILPNAPKGMEDEHAF